jgi:flagellar hook assembly protein FlgD
MRKPAIFFLFVSIGAILVLAGCQTAKPEAAQPSQIQAEATGFSPNAAQGHNTISFGLLFGNKDLVTSWQVRVVGADGPVKTFSGDGKNLPGSLTWDGASDTSTLVPEGTYTASLSVEYGAKLPKAAADSARFVVDLTPPDGALAFDPSELTPGQSGATAPVKLTITASSALAKIQGWSMSVFDSSGKLFQSFSGNWPDNSVTWDGKGMSGEYVQPSSVYSAVATISDEYGLNGTAKAALPVGAAAIASTPVPPAPARIAPVVVPAGQDAVQAGAAGFSPKSESAARAMDLLLTFGDPSKVKSWRLAVESADKGVQKTFSGESGNLPRSVSWDGKADAGGYAPDGTYTASLSVDYGANVSSMPVHSRPFILDVTPPSGSIAPSEPLFSPLESSDTIALTVRATSPVAKIDSWSMNIYDPGGNLFRTFSARWPDNHAVWNGKGISGDMVISAEDYPVKVAVRDEFGNVGELTGTVPIDILVYKTPAGLRIQSSRIFFKPFTDDYRDVAPEIARQNIARLDALAQKLKKFPDYRIRMVGHAVMIYWDNPTLGKQEQEDVLIPLSKARAKAVEAAMVSRGLSAQMFVTDGVGAADQIVPDSNIKERWQNRRVALYLEKSE